MRILLVTSPHLNHSIYHQGYDYTNLKGPFPFAQTFVPMGLISLAGAIDSSVDVKIIDINKAINSGNLPLDKHFYEATAKWLLNFQPDVIGFMTESDSYHHLIRICQSLKDQNPVILTLLGGVYATVTHFETIRDFKSIDFVLRGEGEIALQTFTTALLGGINLKEVGNLTFRDGENIIVTPELPLIHDLDTLPWPDFSRVNLEPQDDIWIEIGRGCPFKCNFCVTAPYWKRKHRIKSPQRIIRELSYIKDKYNRTDYNFTHDLFTTDRRWVINFCQEMVKSDLNVTWTCSSRTDTIDEEQIYWLSRAGCRDIYFGLETGTPEMQRKIDKNLNLEHAEYIIKKTKESGINVTIGFISGLPDESKNSLQGTLKKAYSFLRIPGATVHLFGYGPYKGSPIFEAIKNNLVFDHHFADFPLPEQMHIENCNLMESHFDVFSRYSRFNSYENIDVKVIRAAEEYLPIISTLRETMFVIESQGIEPLSLLVAWAAWIEEKNKLEERHKAFLYYGAIKDYITFLEDYLQRQNLLTPMFKEIIEWELLKDHFRTNAYKIHKEKFSAIENETVIYTNPSAITRNFKYVKTFSNENSNVEPGVFVFYAKSNATTEIVRIQPIVQVILDIAKLGVTLNGIIESVLELAGEQSLNKYETLQTLIEQLTQQELLVIAPTPKLQPV